jgi:hypothetical protein
MEEAAAFFERKPSAPEPPAPGDTLVSPEDVPGGDRADQVQSGIRPQEPVYLSAAERQSAADSAAGFLEFAKRRVLSLAADHAVPVIGGRMVDMAFEISDVIASARALVSGRPVLELPLPSPVPGIGVTVKIPLADGPAGVPAAVCISPDTPSLTGGWALEPAQPAERPEDNPHARTPQEQRDDTA